ncbi:restriction endonuclease subunit S [uncultured Alistipes sp.]|uniref:restriction endonuclease subunit S n=1 Tax=uncultured Alistipes sp. TaxID=538949 RepID=UPI00261A0CC3|nr:restriction endonuclease subunit S [uncultured Alistipes sp.]
MSAIVEMLFCIQGGVLLRLGDIGSFVRGLTYSNEDITEDVNATTVIRANNLNYGNNVNKEDVVYVNKKPAEIQILRKGDIVICMSNGSSSLVGKNSYYSFDDRHSTIGAFCGVYRTSQQLVKWLMQSQRYKRLVYQSLQGGNGAIANLNGDDILNMTFRVVEHEKNVSILSALGLTENSIAVNENLQELYSAQKVYLLRHLFI